MVGILCHGHINNTQYFRTRSRIRGLGKVDNLAGDGKQRNTEMAMVEEGRDWDIQRQKTMKLKKGGFVTPDFSLNWYTVGDLCIYITIIYDM